MALSGMIAESAGSAVVVAVVSLAAGSTVVVSAGAACFVDELKY